MTDARALVLILLTLAAAACRHESGTPSQNDVTRSPSPASAAVQSGTDCTSRGESWLAARRVAESYPADLPFFGDVGDCWVAAGDLERARTWLRSVKALGKLICDMEGVTCEARASEELRRVDCGAGWVAPSAEAAWRDFLDALDKPDADPRSRRVAPDVRPASGTDTLAETCPASAFDLPASVRADREAVGRQIRSSTATWGDRSVSVRIRPEDVPWRNYAPGVYRFFRLRACPTTRPVPAAREPGFAIEITPVETDRIDPPCGA